MNGAMPVLDKARSNPNNKRQNYNWDHPPLPVSDQENEQLNKETPITNGGESVPI